MIVLWNTRYIEQAIGHMETTGSVTDPLDVARLSPVAHEHINFFGRYTFDLTEDVARGEMRPLARPDRRRWSAA